MLLTVVICVDIDFCMFYDANIGERCETVRTWIIIGDFILNIGLNGLDGCFLCLEPQKTQKDAEIVDYNSNYHI